MKASKWILALVVLIGMTSCNTYYRMFSRINPDGSMYREVYAYGDSAFLSGDNTHSPFLFKLDANWTLHRLDSVEKSNYWGDDAKFNVKVCRRLPKVGSECFSTLDKKEYMLPLVSPTEKLEKHFRWFYTNYKYTATYSKLPDVGPVSIDKYMSKEEQKILFRGNDNTLQGLNGIELKARLDDIEGKFWKWYNRTQYELSYEVILHFVTLKGDAAYAKRLEKLKEPIYEKYFSGNQSEEVDNGVPEKVCSYLDEYAKTKYYSAFYEANKKAIDDLLDERGQVAQLFGNTIHFELAMPGKVTSTNASNRQDNSLLWKVDGFRLLGDNYVLIAESRIINIWPFIVTIAILVFAAIYCGILYKKYRRFGRKGKM